MAEVVSIKTGRPLPFGGVDPIPTMLATEGWVSLSEDSMLWLHGPTRHVAEIWRLPRSTCTAIACWGPEPTDPEAVGYLIALGVRDAEGHPLSGDQFWAESFETAIKLARRCREKVLRESGREVRRV